MPIQYEQFDDGVDLNKYGEPTFLGDATPYQTPAPASSGSHQHQFHNPQTSAHSKSHHSRSRQHQFHDSQPSAYSTSIPSAYGDSSSVAYGGGGYSAAVLKKATVPEALERSQPVLFFQAPIPSITRLRPPIRKSPLRIRLKRELLGYSLSIKQQEGYLLIPE